MATKLKLTRDQLASFLQDHEQIKQFEKLFADVQQLEPTTLNDITVTAGNAEQKAIEALDALKRIDDSLGLMATSPAPQQNNSIVTDYIDFNTSTPDPAVQIGRLHWNGGYTLNLEMTPNVNQLIGESQFYYIKASAAISKGQLIMFDGAVGSSGVLQGKPSTGVTNGQLIMGVAAENIALNDFGLISSFGLVRGFNTSGAPYGETWADGDILYYNPSYAGGLTKTQPLSPTPHVVVAAVVNAASGGSGSVFVRVQAEPLVSQLSDVYITSLANNDILVYDGTDMRWENKAPAAARTALGLGSGLSVTITTAKLTAGGTDGSMTFTNGILTAQTQAT